MRRAALQLGREDDFQDGMKEMSTLIATFYSAYFNAYFPDIIRDTLTRRLDRLKQAADLLLSRYSSTGDPECLTALRCLRNDLFSSQNFEVGR